MKNEKTEIDLAEELEIATGKAIDEYKMKRAWDSLCIRSSHVGVDSHVNHNAYEYNIAGTTSMAVSSNTMFVDNVAIVDYFNYGNVTMPVAHTSAVQHININQDAHLGSLNFDYMNGRAVWQDRPVRYNIELYPGDDINITITGSARGNFNVRDDRENR
jgi:hypothetical protein